MDNLAINADLANVVTDVTHFNIFGGARVIGQNFSTHLCTNSLRFMPSLGGGGFIPADQMPGNYIFLNDIWKLKNWYLQPWWQRLWWTWWWRLRCHHNGERLYEDGSSSRLFGVLFTSSRVSSLQWGMVKMWSGQNFVFTWQ